MIKNRAAALMLTTAFAIAAMPAVSAAPLRLKNVSSSRIAQKGESPADIHTLIQACKDGDVDEVRNQLSQGVDPRGENNEALASAIMGDHYEIAEMLLGKGADVHAHNKHFIMLAAMRGRNQMIELLLKYKASVHGNGNMPLAQAAANGHIDTIDFLLDNEFEKADINGNHGWALASAVNSGAIDSIKHLLKRGADSSAGSVESTYSYIKGNSDKMADPVFKEVIEIIEADRAAHPGTGQPTAQQPEFVLEEKSKPALTPQQINDRDLVIGIHTGDLDLVKKALEQEADPDARGGTPLYTAAMLNNFPAMKMLLEKGANPNLQKGWIMVEALENANVDAVMLLLKHGADPLLDGVDAFLESYATVMEKETPETSPRHFAPEMKAAIAIIQAARSNSLASRQKPSAPSPQ